MTGGGFGGCTINLVDAAQVDEFRNEIANSYEKATGRHPETYLCRAEDGAGHMQVEHP